MARINVEDTIYRDERFMKLVVSLGQKELAMGALVFAWDLAARFARSPSGLIPNQEFESLRYGSELFAVGLAERRDGGVYVKGAEKQCEHIRRHHVIAVNTGQAGGLKSQENRRRQIKGLNDSSSSSSSGSSSKNNTYAQQVERLYQDLYPRKLGKSKGMKTLARGVKSDEDLGHLETAIRNYAKHCSGKEPQYIQHFSTFASSWRDWIDFKPEQGSGVDWEKLKKDLGAE